MLILPDEAAMPCDLKKNMALEKFQILYNFFSVIFLS